MSSVFQHCKLCCLRGNPYPTEVNFLTSVLQVTYRVIHVADGQMEAQVDGTAAVSVVTGFPAATQAGTPPVTRVTGSIHVVSLVLDD